MACVLVVELVGFNAVTPSLGESLLRVVAGRLGSALGAGDVAARLGDERFAILVSREPQPQSTAALAKHIIDLLSRSYLVEGNLLNIGAGVGIALIPTDGTTYEEVVKNASLALDRARQQGRGEYRFYETVMECHAQERRSLEHDLRSALALREFALAYQPQLNIAGGRITGFEALLRWRSPKRGLVSPAGFIALAEEIGLIVPLGEWVLRAACREAASWPNQLGIAVNVSPVQFASANLVPTILAALAESGLDPRRLELEITESVMLGDKVLALEVLHTVRAMGIRVSMDDFGTGYSSLSSLRSFTFDKIKIDQSFVRGHPDDPSGVAIVRAVAALGRSLGMSTMAEGVETREQLSRIIRDGCTDVQGYLISRPLPPEKIAEFLRCPIESAIACAQIDVDSSGRILPS